MLQSVSQNCLDDFAEKTHIANIVDRKLVPLGVAIAVECALSDYEKDSGRMIAMMTRMNLPIIYSVLLQSDPKALEDLKAQGIIK